MSITQRSNHNTFAEWLVLTAALAMSVLLGACAGNDRAATRSPSDVEGGTPATTVDLNGRWVLVEYLDSITARRSVARFRSQAPAQFAILLEIEGETLRSVGSLTSGQRVIALDYDTLCTIESHGSWTLRRAGGGDRLELIGNPSDTGSRIETYSYRRADSLTAFAGILKPVELEPSMTDYFNRTLIAGSYRAQMQAKGMKKRIVFTPEGKVEGWGDYQQYRVYSYFGTLHQFDEQDVLRLTMGSDSVESFGWRFAGDTLLVSAMKADKNAPGELFHEGPVIARLLREPR